MKSIYVLRDPFNSFEYTSPFFLNGTAQTADKLLLLQFFRFLTDLR